MPKPVLILSAAAAVLSGCSAASGAPLDSANDVHCFGLASAYASLARSSDAPDDQQRSTNALAQWYSVGFDAAVQARGREAISEEAARLAQAADADPEAARAALSRCADRAAADPGFNAFAAQHGF